MKIFHTIFKSVGKYGFQVYHDMPQHASRHVRMLNLICFLHHLTLPSPIASNTPKADLVLIVLGDCFLLAQIFCNPHGYYSIKMFSNLPFSYI